MKSPIVSVIMNCLNGEQYLSEALDSVFSQTYSNWEIVFWDNGSTDKSGEIAKGYGEKLRYFRSGVTTSLGIARNKAYEKCKGEYIAILDVDDIWLPEKLECQMKLFDNNPDIGLTFSNTIFFDNERDHYDMFKFDTPSRGKVFGELLSQNFISTETMIYRKKALDELPYVFDDEFTMVMDYDLSLRIAYNNNLDYVERPLSKWRMHENSESSKKGFLIWKENQILIEKLCKENPKIKHKYKKQLNNSLKLINCQFALEKWRKENTKEARSYLSCYLDDPKFLILYLSTFFLPFHFVDSFKDLSIIKYLRAMMR